MVLRDEIEHVFIYIGWMGCIIKIYNDAIQQRFWIDG